MAKPTITIAGVSREMTAEEFAQYEIDQQIAADAMAEKETKAAEKAALLAQLGITEDQAKLLLS